MKIGLISDLHSNFEALRTVEAAARNRVDAWWCAGDVNGYGPNPVETLDLFRTMMAQPGSNWAIGNYELMWTGAIEARYGREVARIAKELNDLALLGRPELRAWYGEEATKPARRRGLTIDLDGTSFLLRHTPYDDLLSVYLKPLPSRYQVLEEIVPAVRQRFPDSCGTVGLVFGHSHIPTLILIRGSEFESVYVDLDRAYSYAGWDVVLMNPGSVGQSRDGDPRAAYAILDGENREVTFHRLDYDRSKTTAALSLGGYPNDLVATIDTAPLAWEDLPEDYRQFLRRRAAQTER